MTPLASPAHSLLKSRTTEQHRTALSTRTTNMAEFNLRLLAAEKETAVVFPGGFFAHALAKFETASPNDIERILPKRLQDLLYVKGFFRDPEVTAGWTETEIKNYEEELAMSLDEKDCFFRKWIRKWARRNRRQCKKFIALLAAKGVVNKEKGFPEVLVDGEIREMLKRRKDRRNEWGKEMLKRQGEEGWDERKEFGEGGVLIDREYDSGSDGEE